MRAARSLAIVLGTYNRLPHLKTAIESLRITLDGLPAAIFVVDGGSTDGTRKWLREQPEDVLTIAGRLDGAVRTFNRGFKEAIEDKYDFIGHFNDDAIAMDVGMWRRAIETLEADSNIGAVAFKFDLRDPKYSYDVIHGGRVYSNFGVYRTRAVRLVAKAQGDSDGFNVWNPVYRTYGADAEVGAWLYRLSFTIHRSEDRVHDVNVKDGLRRKNTAGQLDSALFWKRWPTSEAIETGFGGPASWLDRGTWISRILGGKPILDIEMSVPSHGYLPPASASLRPERVLHVSLETETERQPSLKRALVKLGSAGAGCIDWVKEERRGTLVSSLLKVCRKLQPTVIFMQLQRAGTSITPSVIEMMRRAAQQSDLVIINWDGDLYHEPGAPERQWFVELGRWCDTSLVVATHHLAAYLELGVNHPGYLQIGVDDRYFAVVKQKPSKKPVTPKAVLLAGLYEHIPGYARRRELVTHLEKALGPEHFAVYGHGWNGFASARPFVLQDAEPPIYRTARAAISISRLNDAPRYTSDRLFRAMASGALVLVEKFPDMEGLGLKHGVNVWVWERLEELADDLKRFLGGFMEKETVLMRVNARDTARKYHTWDVRMLELNAIIERVRDARKGPF